ncbi:MAG TPA: biopolymer transporter ExbD [Spirochaetota bacterium]|nr:biopolymer transporter ExbD [Spirochaetota bacterium]
MKITRSRKNYIKSEINITPFTDVVLVLLIIFMIATPIIIQSSITVNLPKSKYGEESGREQFEVIIRGEREIYFNNRATDLPSLKEQLAGYVKDRPDAPLIIKADRDIKYYMIINIMDMAKESGVGKISLNVEKK